MTRATGEPAVTEGLRAINEACPAATMTDDA